MRCIIRLEKEMGWAQLQAKNFGNALGNNGQRREGQIAEMAKVFEHLKGNPSPDNTFKAYSYILELAKEIQKENNNKPVKLDSALVKMCNQMLEDVDPNRTFRNKRIDQIKSASDECRKAINKTDVKPNEPNNTSNKRMG